MAYFLRMLAGLFLLLATVALVADLTRYMNGQGLQMTSLFAHWTGLSPQSLKTMGQFVQRYAHPYLWDPAMVRILVLPTWLVLGALGVVFGLLGRRKRRVNIFTN